MNGVVADPEFESSETLVSVEDNEALKMGSTVGTNFFTNNQVLDVGLGDETIIIIVGIVVKRKAPASGLHLPDFMGWDGRG